jgi:2'-5' RNA ligase
VVHPYDPPVQQEAALILVVPEAEPVIGAFRMRYDPSAALGVPAHITINYPFHPHFGRGADAHSRLAEMASVFRPFDFQLTRVTNFPDVIFLAPDPGAPFLELIRSVAAAFPDSPPYQGQFEQIVPHLTVAHVEPDQLERVLAEVSEAARPALPIHSRATELFLIDNTEGPWRPRTSFPFAG